LAEAEAVIGDSSGRYGGWLALSDEALYVGRQGRMGLGRTKSVQRIRRADIEEHHWRPSTERGATQDLMLITPRGPIAAYLRDGRDLIQALETSDSGNEIKRLQESYAVLNATPAPLLAEVQQMSAIRARLSERGAEIDWELCAKEKRKTGVADTPYNTQETGSEPSRSRPPPARVHPVLRQLGSDQNGRTVVVRSGRYGPYISDGETNARVPDGEAFDAITLGRAVELLINAGSFQPPTDSLLRTLVSEADGSVLFVGDDDSGPYVTNLRLRVPIPEGEDVDTMTLERAHELLYPKQADEDTAE
jgi:hypothetical protein